MEPFGPFQEELGHIRVAWSIMPVGALGDGGTLCSLSLWVFRKGMCCSPVFSVVGSRDLGWEESGEQAPCIRSTARILPSPKREITQTELRNQEHKHIDHNSRSMQFFCTE